MSATNFLPKLKAFIKARLQEQSMIPAHRQEKLLAIAHFLHLHLSPQSFLALNYVCTHNSRRSQIAQIWSWAAAHYFGLENLRHFSGGTEVTAFNENAVKAMERAGFQTANDAENNPKYRIVCDPQLEPLLCFSKYFDDPYNPQKDFIALMTCSDAETNCPFIPGTKQRFSLNYEDPKVSDGTSEEEYIYDQCVQQIAREILFLMQELSSISK